MNRQILACHVPALLSLLLALTMRADGPALDAGTGVPRAAAEWRNSRVGGGGYITGLIPDPNTPGRIWARCDVAGVFLSEDGGRSFRAMNRGMTASSHHSVESFALSPHDPKVLFRCSGDARGDKSFGFIHGSWDGGQTWRLLTEQADFIGNGETRYLGEMIAVDPFDPKTVVAASFSRGVFASHDGGEHWTCTGLAGEPLKSLAFNPRIPNRLYVGTLTTMAHADYLFPSGHQRPKVGRLYRSEDKGRTWTLLAEGPELAFADLQFSPEGDEILYAAAGKLGLLKSVDGGHHFKPINQGLPPVEFPGLAVDPREPRTLYTAACVGADAPVPVVPLYVSHDAGASWSLLKDYQPSDFTEYPYPPGDIRPIGWAISKVRIDPFDSKTLYMSNWFGVSVSHDGGQHWSGNHYEGIENICVENVVAHPTKPGCFYFAAADQAICRSDDDGRHFQHFGDVSRPANYYCSTCAAPSRFTTGLVVYGVNNNGSQHSAFCRTEDDGVTVTCSLEPPGGLMIQGIREDAMQPGVFLASVDGELAKGAGLYRSADAGRTWTRLLDGGLPGRIKRVPQDREWVENELLPVVWYQTKNACGTNQMLVAIPGEANGFYWGEWTQGLFRTADGGRSWVDISAGLPFNLNSAVEASAPRSGERQQADSASTAEFRFKRYRPATMVCVTADPEHPRRVYAGFIGEGLWRSDDQGAHWAKLFPLGNQPFNASSIAVGGPGPDDLYVSCEPLGLSPCLAALLHSSNGGRTWTDLYDPGLGALRMKTIAVNRRTGTIEVGTCGNGTFRVVPKR
jgi:photosystem II stability/assembly factor-like uncharacterized protein